MSYISKFLLFLAVIALASLSGSCVENVKRQPPAFNVQQKKNVGVSAPIKNGKTASLEDNAPGKLNGIVAAHNVWRAKVGSPPLVWSDRLAKVAQQWAEKLASENCSMYHHRTGFGENIGRWRIGKGSPENVVNRWAAEGQYYNYASASCAPGKVCGHYTQIVWNDTRAVGCGMAQCGHREVWVCNYDPPGNYRGRKPY